MPRRSLPAAAPCRQWRACRAVCRPLPPGEGLRRSETILRLWSGTSSGAIESGSVTACQS